MKKVIVKSLFIKTILFYTVTPHNKLILIKVNIFIRTEKTLVFMYISTLWNKTFSLIHAHPSGREGKSKKTKTKPTQMNCLLSAFVIYFLYISNKVIKEQLLRQDK
jgi:hypothetical protein